MSQAGLVSVSSGGSVITPTSGGTGVSNPPAHTVAVAEGSSPFNFVGPGTSGQLFQSKGASTDPAYTTATYPSTTTINQILYSSAANTIGGLSTANNGVLITSGTGVPSISSTLPSAVQGNITAVGTLASGIVPTILVVGSTSGSAPSAGFIGEQIRQFESSVGLTGSQVDNVASITITAGIWDVSGIVFASYSNSVTTAGMYAGISTTNNSLTGNSGDNSGGITGLSIAASGTVTVSIPSFRVTLSSSTTYYLNAEAFFGAGSCTAK